MLERGFLKPKITTNKIGKRQFGIGLVIGLFFAILINHFFNLSREALRSITFINDPYILSFKDFRLYDLFFAAFSSSLGFGITVICWFYLPKTRIDKKYRATNIVATSFFVTFLAFATVSRFGSIIPVILYSNLGYDNHLNLLKDFWLLLILIPVYVFFANWNLIRLLFKTNNWIIITIIAFLISTMFLFKTTNINRDILNQKYYTKNEHRFEFIDNEFDSAKKYGVNFSDSTKLILQKRYAERTTDLVQQLKDAFNRDKLVSIDTLILEKIVIHNCNSIAGSWHRPIDSTEQNWSYAFPENIYYQILKHDINSPETQILFEILSEQILIFTARDYDWRNRQDFTKDEIDRYYYKRKILYNTSTIQSRLKHVIERLSTNGKYKNYNYLIPDFEFIDMRGQKHYKIK